MCLCRTDVQYSYFVSPDRYQYRIQLSTDSKFCMQSGTPISMPTTRTPFIGWLYFIYQSIGQIISFQMMSLLRSFDDLDGKERGQKKTDDLMAMTTLRPRTLFTLRIQDICKWTFGQTAKNQINPQKTAFHQYLDCSSGTELRYCLEVITCNQYIEDIYFLR